MISVPSRASVRLMDQKLRFVVGAETVGLRLDQAIALGLPTVSRTRARALLAVGAVFVDGKRTKVSGRIVRQGQRIQVFIGQEHLLQRPVDARPVDIPVVLETDDFVVVEKPTGVFCAPTPQTDQNDLLQFLRRQLHAKNGAELFLVHRLDRPTSGLMVVAKSKSAAAHLGAQVAQHSFSRTYEALLAGDFEGQRVVEAPLSGKAARSEFRLLHSLPGLSWVEVTLTTGRTHQVRLHAETLHAPVAGDSKYGRSLARRLPVRPPRLALHARTLAFDDPTSGLRRHFESPFPVDLREYWERAKVALLSEPFREP